MSWVAARDDSKSKGQRNKTQKGNWSTDIILFEDEELWKRLCGFLFVCIRRRHHHQYMASTQQEHYHHHHLRHRHPRCNHQQSRVFIPHFAYISRILESNRNVSFSNQPTATPFVCLSGVHETFETWIEIIYTANVRSFRARQVMKRGFLCKCKKIRIERIN